MFRNEFDKILMVCPFEEWNLPFVRNMTELSIIQTKVTMR